MKKLFVILFISGFAVACGGGGNEKNPETEDRKEEAQDVAKETEAAGNTANADYQKGLDLVAQSDCFTCHKVNEQATGPAYQAVAAKYQNKPEAVEALAEKVIKGGAGNWGNVPMTPHPQISKEDATTMVKYILSLKQE